MSEYPGSYDTSNPRERSTFTKTKFCTFYMKGVCRFGYECSYAHSYDDLRDQPNLTKTRLCPELRKGQCSRGLFCQYAHCRDELRGTDDVYKTAICRFWLSGHCSAGKHCRHAHGSSDLRIKGPQVVAAPLVYEPGTPSVVETAVTDQSDITSLLLSSFTQ
jgi:hypothetical protein